MVRVQFFRKIVLDKLPEALYTLIMRQTKANEIQTNLISQLQYFGVRGLTLVLWDAETIKINKGTSGALIRYNAGTDLYDVTFYRETETEPVDEGYYADMLDQVISKVRTMAKEAK